MLLCEQSLLYGRYRIGAPTLRVHDVRIRHARATGIQAKGGFTYYPIQYGDTCTAKVMAICMLGRLIIIRDCVVHSACKSVPCAE